MNDRTMADDLFNDPVRDPSRALVPVAPDPEPEPEPENGAEPEHVPENYSEFDWCSDPDVIVGEQRALAVYRNRSGAVVIRQERSWDEEEDPYIVVRPEHVDAVVAALKREAKAAGKAKP